VYTDSTADLIAQLFTSLASNSRVVTLDSGGWLMPGVQAVANRTGRPEQVIPPGRGGYGGGTVVLQNHGVIGSQAQLEDWLVRSMDSLKRKRRVLTWPPPGRCSGSTSTGSTTATSPTPTTR
jgi:hypothetical protein